MNNKFNIDQIVHHKTNPDQCGIIIDICFYYREAVHEYYVSFGFGATCWCSENEITIEKRVI